MPVGIFVAFTQGPLSCPLGIALRSGTVLLSLNTQIAVERNHWTPDFLITYEAHNGNKQR